MDVRQTQSHVRLMDNLNLSLSAASLENEN